MNIAVVVVLSKKLSNFSLVQFFLCFDANGGKIKIRHTRQTINSLFVHKFSLVNHPAKAAKKFLNFSS